MPTYEHQVARLWTGIRNLCLEYRYEHRLRGAYMQLLLVNRDVIVDVLDEYYVLVRAFALYGGMGGASHRQLADGITPEGFTVIVELYLSFYQKVRAGARGRSQYN